MNITVDANILFAALIKEGETRKWWFHAGFVLFAPEFLLVELSKYEHEIEKKYKGKNFRALLFELIKEIHFIPDKDLIPYLPAAQVLSKDSKDWLYLACALKENTVIWSHDAGFQKQARVIIKTTTELIEEMGKL